MKKWNLQLIRFQLDIKFSKFKYLEELIQKPKKGWIYTIRTALGLNLRQLAHLMEFDISRISKMEKEEIKDSLTLKSLREAANALECDLVYVLIPKTSLEKTVKNRAEKIVSKQLKKSSHTMSLEKQELDEQQEKQLFNMEVERLCKETPKHLWE